MIATVPTVLRMLVDSPALARCTAVQQVVVGCEQLSGKLAADLAERLAVPLHNLYGPTEATIDVTAHTCLPTDRYADAVPIGGPLANARLYLLDQDGELVPVGAVGHPALNQMIAWSTLPLGFLVLAPLASRAFEPLLAPGGALAGPVEQVIGVGSGRGIGLVYIVVGLAIAALTAVGLRTTRLGRFDADVPDAAPDDLVGLQTLKRRHAAATGSSPVGSDV